MPNGKLLNLLGDYRNAAKAAAEEAGCPFIDMWQRTTDYFETAGPVKSKQFFRHDAVSCDYTHTNDMGGRLIAKLFAQEALKKADKLAEHIETGYLAVYGGLKYPGVFSIDALEGFMYAAGEHSDIIGFLHHRNAVLHKPCKWPRRK